ncbi:short-chain fatty acid transporter, partial [Salmonella enterica subsp. enterica serovar Enteritidis]|nr:short-chain fatty acid transporter [Salmonella enterica subsp. enterica serovar Enteritidis]
TGAHTHTAAGHQDSAGSKVGTQFALADGGPAATSSPTSSSGNHYHSVTMGAHTHAVVMGSHTHTITMGTHTHSITLGTHNHTLTINSTGDAENTVKNIAFNYIVRLA